MPIPKLIRNTSPASTLVVSHVRCALSIFPESSKQQAELRRGNWIPDGRRNGIMFHGWIDRPLHPDTGQNLPRGNRRVGDSSSIFQSPFRPGNQAVRFCPMHVGSRFGETV